MSVPTALAGLAVTGMSYRVVRSGDAHNLDATVTRKLTANGSVYDRLIAIASDFGSVYAVGGAAVTLAQAGRRTAAKDVLLAGLAAWGLAQSAKPLMRRDRPYTNEAATRTVAVPHGSSWPSGHTAVATAVATVVAARTGMTGRICLAGYVAAVGVSRIRVGVHYATDILAGAGVGLVAAAVTKRRLRHGQR